MFETIDLLQQQPKKLLLREINREMASSSRVDVFCAIWRLFFLQWQD